MVLNLNKNLHKEGFALSKNQNYCKTRLGSLFEIDTGIPINYHLSETLNKCDILISRLDYVNKGDTLIMDGGYYSNKLINILIDREINFIFRTPSSNLFAKSYINDNKLFNLTTPNKTISCKIH